MHACVRMCVCTCVCTCVCVCVCMCVCSDTPFCLVLAITHTHTHTYVLAYIHIHGPHNCTHTYMHTYMHVHTHIPYSQALAVSQLHERRGVTRSQHHCGDQVGSAARDAGPGRRCGCGDAGRRPAAKTARKQRLKWRRPQRQWQAVTPRVFGRGLTLQSRRCDCLSLSAFISALMMREASRDCGWKLSRFIQRI